MAMKKARKLFDQALSEAELTLQQEARAVLRKHPEVREVVCGMGTIFFVDWNGNVVHAAGSRYEINCFEMEQALRDFEEMFDATYGPWRFTKDGPIVYDW